MSNQLFNIPIQKKLVRKEKCKDCAYSQRWGLNDKSPKVFWYCSARKSKLTNNGLLKIKASQTACDNFKEDADE